MHISHVGIPRVLRLGVIGCAVGAAIVASSCSGDGPTGPKFGPPTVLLIEGGQDQSGVVATELPIALTAKVVDAQGRPVRGQAVNFRVVSGGGTVFAGVAITSDSGIARERWTLGTIAADSQRVEARAVNEAGTAIVFGVFRATARPNVPASIVKVAGDTQSVVVGTSATDSLAVRVLDRHGNPVPQTTVRWVVTSGGGTVSADSSITAADGVARTRWTVGQQVGVEQRVTATVGSLSAQTFQATVQAAAAVGVAIVTPAAGAASGAAFTTAPSVRLVDAFGNPAVGSTNAVTLAVSTGGTLSGTVTLTPTAGVATFTEVGLSGVVGDYTLTYAATGLTAATQTIALIAGAPTQLVITTQPAGAVSGAPFTTQPVVELRDNAGNRTASTATVTASIATGDGTLLGTANVAAVAGVATFTDLRVDRAQAHTIRFAAASPNLSAVSAAVVVAPGAPAQLAIVTAAAGAASGAAFTTQPVIEIRDAAGNRTGSTAAVTVAVSAGGTLVGTAAVSAVDGQAIFVGLGVGGLLGEYTLTFICEGVPPVSQPISLAVGAPSKLVIVTPAAGAESGAMFAAQPVIEIHDAAGNLTASNAEVTLTASAGGALAGIAAVSAVSGVATFAGVKLSGLAGDYILTYTANGLAAITQTVALTAGAPTQLVITTQPAGAVSGAPFTTQPVVELRDNAGNRTASSAMVTASIASGGGTLLGTASVAAVSGTAIFTNLRIDRAVAHTLTFRVATPDLSATSDALTVSPATVSVPPSTATQPVTASLLDGAVTVTVPAGATASTTALTVEPAPTVPSDDRVLPGTSYMFGPAGTTFTTPITIGLRYDPTLVPFDKREELRMVLVGLTGLTEVSGGSVDIANSRVLAPVAHFSTYAILMRSDPASITVVSTGSAQEALVGTVVPIAPAVKVLDAQGRPVPRAEVRFRVGLGGGTLSDTLSVETDASGLATLAGTWTLGPSAGTNTLTATVVGTSLTATVTATANLIPVATVAVTPDTLTLQLGQVGQLTAVPKAADETLLTGRTVAWVVADTAIAKITATGLVTARTVGMTLATATVDGKQGKGWIRVIPPPVGSVEVRPTNPQVGLARTLQLTAVVMDSAGVVLSGRSVSWASSDTLVASVDTSGAVSGKALGSAIITATSESRSGATVITVVTVPVAAVTVTPSVATLVGGQSLQLSVVARDSSGISLDDRAFDWQSSDSVVATVSNAGMVYATGAGGVAIISVASEGIRDEMSILVAGGPVESIEVSGVPTSFVLGSIATLVAVTKDATGSAVTDRPITWNLSDTSVVRLTPLATGSAVVEAISVGSAVITAQSQGKSGSATITVVNQPSNPLSTLDGVLVGWAEQGHWADWWVNNLLLPGGWLVGRVPLVRARGVSGGEAQTGWTMQVNSREPWVDIPRNRMVYVGERYGRTVLFTGKLDGSGARIVFRADTGTVIAAPSLSPDGTKVAYYRSEVAAPGSAAAWVLGVRAVDGTGIETRVASLGSGVVYAGGGTAAAYPYRPPQWHPDGARIAFEMVPFPSAEVQVYVGSATGTGTPQLVSGGDLTKVARSPSWSPDGTRLVFIRGEVMGSWPNSGIPYATGPLWAVKADGTDAKQLGAARGDNPLWAPNGTAILYRCEANPAETCAVSSDGATSVTWSTVSFGKMRQWVSGTLASLPPAAPGGELRGRVVDAADSTTGVPQAEVFVRVRGGGTYRPGYGGDPWYGGASMTTLTDANGNWSVPGLLPDSFDIRILPAGYSSDSTKGQVVQGGQVLSLPVAYVRNVRPAVSGMLAGWAGEAWFDWTMNSNGPGAVNRIPMVRLRTMGGAEIKAAWTTQKNVREPWVDIPRNVMVYVGERHGRTVLFTGKLDGSETRTLFTVAAGATIAAPSLSPDGTKVAYYRSEVPVLGSSANWILGVRSLDGSGAETLVSSLGAGQGYVGSPYPVRPPQWHPDGLQIAWEMIPSGAATSQVFIGSAAGGASPRIMSGNDLSKRGMSPSWSPDGSRLVYVRLDDLAGSLWTVQLDGTNNKRIGVARGWNPHWAPNGLSIFYQCEVAPTDTCVATPDGSVVTKWSATSFERVRQWIDATTAQVPSAPAGGEFRGRVVSSTDTTKGLPNIALTVRVSGGGVLVPGYNGDPWYSTTAVSVVTDANGNWTLPSVLPDTFEIRVAQPGYSAEPLLSRVIVDKQTVTLPLMKAANVASGLRADSTDDDPEDNRSPM